MTDKKRLIKSVLLGSLCGMLSCVALMCVLAAALLSMGLPGTELLRYLTLAVAALGAFTGGLVAAKCSKGAGLVVGAATGAVMFLLMTIAGLIRGGTAVSALTAMRLAALLAGGVFGGILGIREKKLI